MPKIDIRVDPSNPIGSSRLEATRPQERPEETPENKTLEIVKNLFPIAVCAYLNSAGVVGDIAIYPLVALTVGGVVMLRRNGKE